jgi:hypothetical protein
VGLADMLLRRLGLVVVIVGAAWLVLRPLRRLVMRLQKPAGAKRVEGNVRKGGVLPIYDELMTRF